MALDLAIDRKLDGDSAADRAIARVHDRMKRRTTERLLNTGNDSVGANELTSAAGSARHAPNVRALIEARRDAIAARQAVAEEFASPEG